jgi:hypothetical protein
MSVAANATVVHAPLPFRLRTALGILLLGIGVAVAVPRGKAAYRLYRSVGKMADYGLCMAGPTGAVAIREDPFRFRALVRRRLVAAGGDSYPFEKCASIAAKLTGRGNVEAAYRAPASAFLEWGGGNSSRNLNELYNDLPDLESLHAKSYPFCRKPLSEMVKPSLGAEEAVHPSDPVIPSAVRGLRIAPAVISSTVDTPRGSILMLSDGQSPWAFRTRDQGHNWQATSAWQAAVEGHANRCQGAVGSATFAVPSRDISQRPAILVKEGLIDEPYRREFGLVGERITRLVCDDSGAAVVTTTGKPGENRVYTCPVNSSSCRTWALPLLSRFADAQLDIARLMRTTVVAISKEGLVRVVTSRDEGVTVTPLSLVFDGRDSGNHGLANGARPHLVPMGKRLLLVLTALGPSSKPEAFGLISEDLGASFRAF